MRPDPHSRRDFLRLGAAAATAAALPALLPAADDDFGGFKVGAQSYTFRKFKLEQAVKKIADAGLPEGLARRLALGK